MNVIWEDIEVKEKGLQDVNLGSHLEKKHFAEKFGTEDIIKND
jgi:hypothetical protein